MQIRHNIFSRIIREEQRKRLSEQPEWREPMRWTLPYVEKIKKSPSTDVIITVLNTPEMLWEESVEMSHCVDSFLLECQSEEMMVFRLVSKKGRSTLGFERIGDEWNVFQHYAFDNQPVKCQSLQKEERRLLALLNDDLLAHH